MSCTAGSTETGQRRLHAVTSYSRILSQDAIQHPRLFSSRGNLTYRAAAPSTQLN